LSNIQHQAEQGRSAFKEKRTRVGSFNHGTATFQLSAVLVVCSIAPAVKACLPLVGVFTNCRLLPVLWRCSLFHSNFLAFKCETL